MTAWNQAPEISDAEIDTLLEMFRIADADGLTYADEEWIPTYNFRAAAKMAWAWKMGRCADQVSTDLDGDRMSANQLFEHCERMVRKYSGTPTMNLGQGAALLNTVEEAFFEG